MSTLPTWTIHAKGADTRAGSASRHSRRASTQRTLLRLCRAAIAAALLLTLAGRLGRMAWWLDIWAHFPLQIGVGLGLVAILCAVLKAPRSAVAAALIAAVNLSLLAPLFMPAAVLEVGAAQDAAAGRSLSIISYNVLTRNRNKAAVTDYIRSQSPDVLALIETDDRWLRAVERDLPGYDVVSAVPREDNFGMLLALRRESQNLTLVRARSFDDLSPEWPLVPTIEAQLQLDGRPIDVLVVHTMPPHHIDLPQMRDAMLDGAFAWADGRENPHLIIGDLNTTPFAPRFRAMLEGSELADSSLGRGFQATWPIAPVPLLGIPIDHALLGPGIRLTERRIGPSLGSDHRALHVTIALDG